MVCGLDFMGMLKKHFVTKKTRGRLMVFKNKYDLLRLCYVFPWKFTYLGIIYRGFKSKHGAMIQKLSLDILG